MIPEHKDQKGIPETKANKDQKVTLVDQSVPQANKAFKGNKVYRENKGNKGNRENKANKDPKVKLAQKAHKEKEASRANKE